MPNKSEPTPNSWRHARLVLWILAGLMAVGFPAYVMLSSKRAEPANTAVNFGGPFTLVDSKGAPFSSASLNGKPHAIFFGFTHCPDVCPTTLARLARLRQKMGKGDDSFAIVFITVDPERDTPAAMGQYMSLFNTPVIGLTGSTQQIDQVRKTFGIYSQKVAQQGGEYTVDHSAMVLLFDRDGHFTGTIAPDETDQAATDKLNRIMI